MLRCDSVGKGVYGYGGWVRPSERRARAQESQAAINKAISERGNALRIQQHRSSTVSVEPFLSAVVTAERVPQARARELFKSSRDAQVCVDLTLVDSGFLYASYACGREAASFAALFGAQAVPASLGLSRPSDACAAAPVLFSACTRIAALLSHYVVCFGAC